MYNRKDLEMSKQEEIIQGFNYAKSIINSITVSGIDNCQKISAVYNNIDVLLNMLLNGNISIIENQSTEENKDLTKQKPKGNSNAKS